MPELKGALGSNLGNGVRASMESPSGGPKGAGGRLGDFPEEEAWLEGPARLPVGAACRLARELPGCGCKAGGCTRPGGDFGGRKAAVNRRSLPGYGWWGAAGAAPDRVTRRAEPGGLRRQRNPAGGPQRTVANRRTVTLSFAYFRNPF